MREKLKTAFATLLGCIAACASASDARTLSYMAESYMAEQSSAAESDGDGAAACQASVRPPWEVVLPGNEGALHCELTEMRTAARANGWGGFATYAVLPGAAAALRIPSARPSFLIALPTLPSASHPADKFVLAALAVRRNATREILLAQGFGEAATNIPPERRISTTIVRAPDQSNVPTGYTAWNATPTMPLAPGEYALIVYDRANEDASPHGAGVKHRFYSFGVDPNTPLAD